MTDQADTTSSTATASPTTDPKHPFTLAVDIGGTGLKASVLDAEGAMVADRVKIATVYPLPPEKLVSDLTGLVAPLPDAERASVGFPGMVRAGHVLSAPHFSTKHGPGSHVDEDLFKAWRGFDLATALTTAFGRPTKVANDADIQGAAVVSGQGLELVITLGTGLWDRLLLRGQAHAPPGDRPPAVPQGRDLQRPAGRGDPQGDRRGAVEPAGAQGRPEPAGHHVLRPPLYRWRNSRRLVRDELDDDVTIVDNTAGILGGIKLWETDHVGVNRTASTPPPVRPVGRSVLPAPPAALDLFELLAPTLADGGGGVFLIAASASAGSASDGRSSARVASQARETLTSCRSPSRLCRVSAARAVLRAGDPSTITTVSAP